VDNFFKLVYDAEHIWTIFHLGQSVLLFYNFAKSCTTETPGKKQKL